MKKKSLKYYKTKADKVFSLWIRERDKGRCCTCGKIGEIKEMQAGHYYSRNILSLRYSEINVNCQCVKCNIFLKGNLPEYAIYLKRLHGSSILERLNADSHYTVKYSISDYEEIIERYKP